VWTWLVKVESMGRSLSLYGPVALLEKLITFGRVVVLAWLLGESQYGVWALGVMVFSVFAPVATLGSNEGLARYVSHYQARGRLREFYRRSVAGVCLLAAGMTLLGLLGSGRIADLLVSSSRRGLALASDQRLAVAVLGILNGVLMALFHNLQAWIRAMRTFRMLAVVDLGYTLLFTALALGISSLLPLGCTILVAHAVALAVMLLAGGYASHRCVARQPLAPAGAAETPSAPPPGAAGAKDTPMFVRLLGFGLLSMLGVLAWNVGSQVSAWCIHRYHGREVLGLYAPYHKLCQPAWILSGVCWGLVFSHVARHWESGLRAASVRMLNLTYKAVVLALTTLTVLILATARWWWVVLPESYRPGLALLPGLLMFYQCSANLGLAGIAAKLRERPLVIVGVVAAGVGVNAVLAWLWVPAGGAVAGARAAGIGMLAACAAGAVYLLASRFGAHPAGHVLALAPAALFLPAGWVAAGWAGFLAVAVLSPWVLSSWEKRALLDYVRTLGGRRKPPAG